MASAAMVSVFAVPAVLVAVAIVRPGEQWARGWSLQIGNI